MQGRLISFKAIRAVLESHFHCVVEFLPDGMGIDADGAPSPPVYAFLRNMGEGEVLISTVVVPDDSSPLFATTLRSLLARLRLTVDDVLPYL